MWLAEHRTHISEVAVERLRGALGDQRARSAASMLPRNPLGGGTWSRSTGTRTPRALPSSASSSTQSDRTECSDQATTTQRA